MSTRQVAEALAPRFRARGFDVKIIQTPDTGKVHFIARLKGDGSKRPVLIAAHADVVGVEREKWTVDPFAGVIKDDHVFGRGAIDFKGGMAVFARAAMMLAERKIPLARDVIFLAEADEEGALPYSTTWLAREHWSDIDAEFALNEGGWIMKGDDGGVRYVSISTADKLSIPLTLTAHGTSTHSSMPRPDNAIFTLSRAMAKLSMYETPLTITPATRQFFTALSRTSAPPMSDYFRDVVGSDAGARAARRFGRQPRPAAPLADSEHDRAGDHQRRLSRQRDPRFGAGDDQPAHDSRAATRRRSSPSFARVVGDSTIELSIGSRVFEQTSASSEDTDLYRALVRSAKAQWPRRRGDAVSVSGRDGRRRVAVARRSGVRHLSLSDRRRRAHAHARQRREGEHRVAAAGHGDDLSDARRGRRQAVRNGE